MEVDKKTLRAQPPPKPNNPLPHAREVPERCSYFKFLPDSLFLGQGYLDRKRAHAVGVM